MSLTNDILYVITSRGKDNPIYSSELENIFNISGSEIRNIVRELRRQGNPVGSCSTGYYMAVSFNEIKDTVEDLEGRARSLILTARKLRQTFNVQPTLFDIN